MYARLKYKCSITLLSLLEARTSNENVIRLIKSLNMETLKRNISDIFDEYQTNYKGHYGYELFLHFNLEPEANNQEEFNYASFIIETGFNLFVLYSIFLEVKVNDDDDERTDE